MLLVIDAGNTNITLGVYRGDALLFVSRLATDASKTEDQMAMDLKSILEFRLGSSYSFRGAIISSVVPALNLAMQKAVAMVVGVTPLLAGPGVKTGLNIRIDNPAELGADLVVGAVAAKAEYPLPCLIVDLGTANKISVLDEHGAYLGCTISPGIRLSLNALANGAAQLNEIALTKPDHTIGTNTPDSMRAGIVFGNADMLDGLIDRLNAELKTPVKSIVGTGGLCSICENCRHEIVLDPHLILKGLKYVYDYNQRT